MDFLIENAKIKELTPDDLKKINEKEADSGEVNLGNEDAIEEFTEEEAIVQEILSENKE